MCLKSLIDKEKYNYFLSNLRADTSSCPSTTNEGDLMLYGNNCLVLFYKTFNTSYRYVKLGHINNTTGLAKASLQLILMLLLYIRLKLKCIFSMAFVIKVISQCMPYIGYPRSLNALRCVNDAAKQME